MNSQVMYLYVVIGGCAFKYYLPVSVLSFEDT